MALKISINGTTFDLVISSDAIDASLVAAKFLPLNPNQKKNDSNEKEDRDAVISLNNFTGKLHIRHAVLNDTTNSTTKRNSDNTLSNDDQNNQQSTPQDNRTTLAKVREEVEDFDPDLDHVVISHGEEWYGRITECNLSAEVNEIASDGAVMDEHDIVNDVDAEDEDEDVIPHRNTSLTFKDISDKKEQKKSETGKQQSHELLGFSTDTALISNVESAIHSSASSDKKHFIAASQQPQELFEIPEGTSPISNTDAAISSSVERNFSVPATVDVAAIQTKNRRLSLMLRAKSEISFMPSDDSSKGDARNSINDTARPQYEKDNTDKSSYSSSSVSDNLSYQSLIRTKCTRSIRQQTKLHRLCAQPRTKAKDLFKAFHDSPNNASIQNENGELPLHIIASNQHLLFGRESDDVQVFIDDLIKEHPYGLLTENERGCIPFTYEILKWIDDVHNYCFDQNELVYFDAVYSENKATLIPRVVYADPMVEWSFKMLSEVHNRIETANKLAFAQGGTMSNISPEEEFVLSFANSLSHFVFKTTLLINDDALRGRILDYGFMKRCYLNQRTVSDWLVVFLSNREMSTRGVEYFEHLSKLSTCTALGISKSRTTDVIKFRQGLEDLIVKISSMDHILPALFMLNQQDMKRACLTYPVQRILEISMTDKSLLGLLIFDLCVHLLLVVSFNGMCHREFELFHLFSDFYTFVFSL